MTSKTIQIRGQRIKVPTAHDLDVILAAEPCYDYLMWNIIGEFCRANGLAGIGLIDVGANVGDTIRHFRSFSDGPVWAVEPSETFLPYLQANSDEIADVAIIAALVCPDNMKEKISFKSGERTGGTRLSDMQATASELSVRTVSPATLIKKSGSNVIFKTDTDGFDWAILDALVDDMIAQNTFLPVVCLEGPFADQMRDGSYVCFVEPIARLQELGYQVYIFSNLGLPVAQAGTSRAILEYQLRALHLGYVTKRAPVHYFDFVCVRGDLPEPQIDLSAAAMKSYMTRDHNTY